MDEILERLKARCAWSSEGSAHSAICHPLTSAQLPRHSSGAVTQLDKLHAKHILPGFSDKTAEEREIANVTADITRVGRVRGPPCLAWSLLNPLSFRARLQELRKCQTIITRIAHTARNLPLATTSKEDRVMIQNVQTALATKVQNASTIFRKKQSNYLKRGSRLTSHSFTAVFCC